MLHTGMLTLRLGTQWLTVAEIIALECTIRSGEMISFWV